MVFSIAQKYRDLQRIRKIVKVLVRYGFGNIFSRFRFGRGIFGKLLIRFRIIRRPSPVQPAEVNVRMVLEELGPTFVKLGQMLSLRSDLIPLSYCEELSKLQDAAPPFPYDQVEARIQTEFGRSPEALFGSFEKEPIAAASLSQVHRAELPDGDRVAVKVQRTDIRKTIKTDLHLLYTLARTLERHFEGIRIFNPIGIVDEFSRSITKELDFTIEANNINRFRENFKEIDYIVFPRVYEDHTTSKVLTTEYMEGIKVDDIERIEQARLDRKLLAEQGAYAVLKMIFEDGFFHADPHPGNIFVLPGNKTLFLDLGMTGRLDRKSRMAVADLLIAIVRQDTQQVMAAMMKLYTIDRTVTDMKRLEVEVMDFLDRYYSVSLGRLKVGNLLRDALAIATHNRLSIPPYMALLVKSLVTIEYVGYMLDPDLDFIPIARPFIERLVADRHSISRLAAEVKETLYDLKDLMTSLPGDALVILDQLKSGKLMFDLQHRGLEEFEIEIDRSSNRMAFSIVVAALIVASSLIIQTDMQPRLLGLPAIGLLGYILAGILGLYLIIAIMRRGRL